MHSPVLGDIKISHRSHTLVTDHTMVVRTTSTSSTVYHAAIFGSLGRAGIKCKYYGTYRVLYDSTTVSSSIDSREIPRFLPLYYSYSMPLREVRCFPKTPYFSQRHTVGIVQRGKSRYLPQSIELETVVGTYHREIVVLPGGNTLAGAWAGGTE